MPIEMRMPRMLMPAGLALGLVLVPALHAQDAPIQDNSFLVEEAYNQEAGVVQHVGTWERVDGSDDWVFTFTQEWPLFSQRHQLSYSLPWERLGEEAGSRSGVGDVSLDYRYQLVGDGKAPVAFSPRFSLLLPVGDEEEGRGTGALGYEVNLPVSAVLGPRFVTHFNLGAVWTPGARNDAGDEGDVESYAFAQSFVWLARPKLNLLVEFLYESGEELVGRNLTEDSDGFFISPGVRWAHDLPSGLQIVPGIAWTIGVGPSSGEQGVFLYLSFEHPFQ